MKLISLDKIKVFIAVADEGSLSAAGRYLRKPQSVVSETLSALEGQLGFRVFERTLKKTDLTSHGNVLIDDARAVLAAAERFQAKAESFEGGIEANLQFTADMLFPSGVTMAAINAFRQEFPKTTISFATEALGSAFQPLMDGRDSFAIVGSLPQVPATLVTERIRLVNMCLVAAPDHPLAQFGEAVQLSDLAKHCQIVVSDKTELSTGKSFGIFSPRIWRTAELTSKHDFLRNGFGWGFMPIHTVKQDLQEGRLVEIATAEQNHKDGWLPVALYIAYRRNRPPGRAARWLIERLREGAGDISDIEVYRGD